MPFSDAGTMRYLAQIKEYLIDVLSSLRKLLDLSVLENRAERRIGCNIALPNRIVRRFCLQLCTIRSSSSFETYRMDCGGSESSQMNALARST